MKKILISTLFLLLIACSSTPEQIDPEVKVIKIYPPITLMTLVDIPLLASKTPGGTITNREMVEYILLLQRTIKVQRQNQLRLNKWREDIN